MILIFFLYPNAVVKACKGRLAPTHPQGDGEVVRGGAFDFDKAVVVEAVYMVRVAQARAILLQVGTAQGPGLYVVGIDVSPHAAARRLARISGVGEDLSAESGFRLPRGPGVHEDENHGHHE